MQTLITRKNPYTKKDETLLYVTTYYETGLSIAIYESNIQAERITKKFQHFTNDNEKSYHAKIRRKIRANGGIVHVNRSKGVIKSKTPVAIKYVVLSMHRGTPIVLSKPDQTTPAIFTSLKRATQLSLMNSNSYVAPLYNVIDLLQRSKAITPKSTTLYDELNKLV